jgi:uridylate kinase
MKYKRVLLKLSGEALMGDQQYGIDPHRLNQYISQIHDLITKGVEIGVVIGGGNIFRGISGEKSGISRVKGDYMGMLATVINGLAIQSAYQAMGGEAVVLTAIGMEPVGERYTKERTMRGLKEKELVIFTFGTGNPYFTTDTAATLRGIEMEADLVLKGTRVDGVYSADPEKDPNATRFNQLSYDEVLNRGLKVMDLTAFAMCKENNLPIIVFDMNTEGNLKKVIQGEPIGTVIS